MKIKGAWNEQEQTYTIGFGIANIVLFFGVFFLLVTLFAPLLGGKFIASSLPFNVSMIVAALALRVVSQRGMKGLSIRKEHWAFLGIAVMIHAVVWLSFPVGVLVGTLVILITFIGFKAQKKKYGNNKG